MKIISLFFFTITNTGSQVVQSQRRISPSKCKCLQCSVVFKRVTRVQYEEFTVENSSSLCGDCFHTQSVLLNEAWIREMRRIHGQQWEGFPTRKAVILKRPISLLSSSSSSAAGGGGPVASASSDSVSKGFFSFLPSHFYDKNYFCRS